MKPSLAVQCPTCLSNPGEECAALDANGVTRLGFISTSHSSRQVAALDAREAAEKAKPKPAPRVWECVECGKRLTLRQAERASLGVDGCPRCGSSDIDLAGAH